MYSAGSTTFRYSSIPLFCWKSRGNAFDRPPRGPPDIAEDGENTEEEELPSSIVANSFIQTHEPSQLSCARHGCLEPITSFAGCSNNGSCRYSWSWSRTVLSLERGINLTYHSSRYGDGQFTMSSSHDMQYRAYPNHLCLALDPIPRVVQDLPE